MKKTSAFNIFISYVTKLTYINGLYGRFTKDFLILEKKEYKYIYKKIMYEPSNPSKLRKYAFHGGGPKRYPIYYTYQQTVKIL